VVGTADPNVCSMVCHTLWDDPTGVCPCAAAAHDCEHDACVAIAGERLCGGHHAAADWSAAIFAAAVTDGSKVSMLAGASRKLPNLGSTQQAVPYNL
jgi:hypothetical protein